MFAAQISKKLTRSEEEMEDLLTSNVFGIWRYLPPQFGLVQFLNTAERLDGACLAGLHDVQTVKLHFWPWLQEHDAKGAEPDVLIEMASSNQQRRLVLVEAKYLSGKSSLRDEGDQPNDQLAREMHNLRRLAARKRTNKYALVYITAHTLMPRLDIEEAVSELAEKTGDGVADRFYWTTWRRLASVISEARSLSEGAQATLLGDLETIVQRMGLTFFAGITCEGWVLGRIPWTFERPPLLSSFAWAPINIGRYSFEKAPVRFLWELGKLSEEVSWRFM